MSVLVGRASLPGGVIRGRIAQVGQGLWSWSLGLYLKRNSGNFDDASGVGLNGDGEHVWRPVPCLSGESVAVSVPRYAAPGPELAWGVRE